MSVDKLTATKLKKLGEGKHSDGRGLYFFVRGESRLWTLRYTQNGKRNEISLGRYPDVSLAQARERREEARKYYRRGAFPPSYPRPTVP
ncbi:Arm DNA-binding domain-containing protein [Ruegeria atlantica]|uniref:Putative prophage CPS-53 integrase n=1 Tax=Ruegeria atlantica TaxID=81569 RepID=A0A0P1E5J5_9RHOB|nr:Putative prophage CPS-53 integrase [Ruegeria atlantica]